MFGVAGEAVIGLCGVAVCAFRAEPYSHVVVVVFELVALDIESVGRPTVCGCAVNGGFGVTVVVGVDCGAADEHVAALL